MAVLNTLKKFNSLREGGFTGELTRSFSFNDEPKFSKYQCFLKDEDGNKYESSSIDSDKDMAKVKALGEYIERFCLDNPNVDLTTKTHSEGLLNPQRFVSFRDEDMGGRKNEYMKKVIESKFLSMAGKDLSSQDTVYVPAQLVYVEHPFKETFLRPRISTGAAAHETFEDASIAGIMENIERDSFMITYLTKREIPRVDLEGELRDLETYFYRYKLEVAVYDTTTDLGIPSFMCLNIDRTNLGPAVSVGLSAGYDIQKTIKSAILESQKVREWVRYEHINAGNPKISTPDDIKTILDRGYYWCSTDRISDLDFLLNSDKRIRQSDIGGEGRVSLDQIVGNLKEKGVSSYVVDIAHKNMKDNDFSVVKVIQPELHPLYLEEDMPCLYSERLEKYRGDKDLNRIPHPFL
jgi:ribosomal protein S12 methylthiotransferase accessory factor